MAVKQINGALVVGCAIIGISALVATQLKNDAPLRAPEKAREEIYIGHNFVSSAGNEGAVDANSRPDGAISGLNNTDSRGSESIASAAIATETPDIYTQAFEPVDVSAMVQKADLIIVGRHKQSQGPRYLEVVHGMHDPNNNAAKMPVEELKAQMFLTIDCDRVIKGDQSLVGKRLKWVDPSWENSIHVDTTHGITFDQQSKTFEGIPQINYGIFFLTNKNSKIKYVDPLHPVLPASQSPLTVVSDPYTCVVNELNHVLTTPLRTLDLEGSAPGGESSGGVGGSYEISNGELLMRDAVTVLSQLQKQQAFANFKKILDESNVPLTKLWAFTGMVSLHDWSSFSRVQSYFQNPTNNLHYIVNYPLHNYESEAQTAQGQTLLSSVPNSVLIALIKSTDVDVRQTVSHLMQLKKDDGLLETLATTAINDPDKTVRSNCSSGLSQLTGIVADFWEKEPKLAMEIASGKSAILAFDESMRGGKIFDQSKIAPIVVKEFSMKPISKEQYPEWVTRTMTFADAANIGDSFVNQGVEWSFEGSGDEHGNQKAWYTYTKIYNPAVNPQIEFTVRKTTLCFLIELKDKKFPEINAINVLPPAKILDVWRQDDDTTFKRLPNNGVRTMIIRRLYGADGNPIKVAPSGMRTEATLSDSI